RLLLVALADQVPSRDENLLLPARNLVLLVAATAAAAAALARLREAPLEGLNLDEVEVALGRAAAIFGNDVVGDEIAGLEALIGRRRLGRLRLVGRLGPRLVELTAELRHAEIVEIEDGGRRPPRAAARGTHGL